MLWESVGHGGVWHFQVQTFNLPFWLREGSVAAVAGYLLSHSSQFGSMTSLDLKLLLLASLFFR